jgi:hypothetical protein
MCLLGRDGGVNRGHQTGNRTPRHLQFHVVGFDANHNRILLQSDDRPDNSSRRNDRVPRLKVGEHPLLLLLLALHGKEQKEVHDREHHDQGQRKSNRVGGTRLKEESEEREVHR